MEFANFLTKTKVFLTKRIAELFGFIIIIFSALLLISILTYSPNDPNFIISETENVQIFWALEEVLFQILCFSLSA